MVVLGSEYFALNATKALKVLTIAHGIIGYWNPWINTSDILSHGLDEQACDHFPMLGLFVKGDRWVSTMVVDDLANSMTKQSTDIKMSVPITSSMQQLHPSVVKHD